MVRFSASRCITRRDQLIGAAYEQRKKRSCSKNSMSSTQLNSRANMGSSIRSKRRGHMGGVENPVGEAAAGVEGEVEEGEVEEQQASLVRNLRRTPPGQHRKKRTRTVRWSWTAEAV